MSEEKKIDQSEYEAEATGLSEQDLEQIEAGTVGKGISDIGVGLGKNPHPGSF